MVFLDGGFARKRCVKIFELVEFLCSPICQQWEGFMLKGVKHGPILPTCRLFFGDKAIGLVFNSIYTVL